MRCKRRIPPRHHRPKPPETGQDLSCTAENANSLIGKAFATPFGRNFLPPQHVIFQQNLPFLTGSVDCTVALYLGFQRDVVPLAWGFKRGQRAPLQESRKRPIGVVTTSRL